MLRPRITPCLLISKNGLVKTTQFKAPKYVGDPINAVKIFNEKEADELIVLDIDATVTGAEPDFGRIAHLAIECRMPLCYGGGIKTAEQVKRIVDLGVEKVSISSMAVSNPAIISEMAREVGSQSIAVCLDVRKGKAGQGYEVWTHNATRPTGRMLEDVVADAQRYGAGEIVVNAIDNDGLMKGYDLVLARQVRSLTRLPITILGGAGSLDHMGHVIEQCGVVGVAAGSLFVFKGTYRAVLINYPNRAAKDDLIRKSLASAAPA